MHNEIALLSESRNLKSKAKNVSLVVYFDRSVSARSGKKLSWTKFNVRSLIVFRFLRG